jgi:sigma-E factor negative regulatory protein RseA
MNERQREQLSALLDGELDGAGTDRLLQQLGDDDAALDTIGRYRLIGDAMRGEFDVVASATARRVRAALADEPTVLAPPPRRPASWLRPAVGVAVAASVAAAAVFVAPQILQAPDGGGLAPTPVVALAPSSTEPTRLTTVANVQRVAVERPAQPGWHALNADLEARLNRLVIEHQEFGGHNGINGPVPHIGLVSYDRR